MKLSNSLWCFREKKKDPMIKVRKSLHFFLSRKKEDAANRRLITLMSHIGKMPDKTHLIFFRLFVFMQRPWNKVSGLQEIIWQSPEVSLWIRCKKWGPENRGAGRFIIQWTTIASENRNMVKMVKIQVAMATMTHAESWTEQRTWRLRKRSPGEAIVVWKWEVQHLTCGG